MLSSTAPARLDGETLIESSFHLTVPFVGGPAGGVAVPSHVASLEAQRYLVCRRNSRITIGFNKIDFSVPKITTFVINDPNPVENCPACGFTIKYPVAV